MTLQCCESFVFLFSRAALPRVTRTFIKTKPFRPEDQFVYADVDLKDYGPINYKAASIYAQMKKVKEQQKMQEVYDKQTDDDML
ncbi:hypothetical protein RR46_07211 [Papilio xuthus]|uniref:Uncharacterized protein n=1 Tax=Papilio xuthus TaxID=66420 RepID=A0A194QB22_PAPXU|nr:hypothetical protein RR46_07211 [Papilio xuthus]